MCRMSSFTGSTESCIASTKFCYPRLPRLEKFWPKLRAVLEQEMDRMTCDHQCQRDPTLRSLWNQLLRKPFRWIVCIPSLQRRSAPLKFEGASEMRELAALQNQLKRMRSLSTRIDSSRTSTAGQKYIGSYVVRYPSTLVKCVLA